MKTIFTASALAFALAPPALASDINGAEISLSAGHYFARNLADTLQTGSFEARAEVGLCGGTFLQLDGALEAFHMSSGFLAGTEVLAAFGGHLGYTLSPTAAVGVFATYEIWPDVGESYALGAEVAVESGPVEIEAYAGYRGVIDAPIRARELGAKGYYRLDEHWSLAAGAAALRIDDLGSFAQGTAGLRYDLADDLTLEAGYAHLRQVSGGPGAHSIGLTLTKTIDQGTTFSSRNLLSTLGGW